MHGVVLWKRNNPTPISSISNDEGDTSNLITWQDQRCDEQFLASLPKSDIATLPLSSGWLLVVIFYECYVIALATGVHCLNLLLHRKKCLAYYLH